MCGIVLEGKGESSFCRCAGTCALGLARGQCGMRRGGPDRTRPGEELGRDLGGGPIVDEILPQLVEAVAKALHLSYIAIEMMYSGSRVTVASYGRPSGKLAAVPFTHEGETVAWMLFGRSSRRALRKRDSRALRDLVAPVGAVTWTLRQAVELQRLREQLTAVREEERRRLRRDLHDAVAPSVAAAALHLQTAEDLIPTDPSAAKDLIGRVREGTKDLVNEMRRLAGCLGHSSVDQVGLVCAIRERAWCLAETVSGTALPDAGLRERVTVEAAGNVDNLPAATEAAAFDIVSEVLVAVLGHGGPTGCHVQLDRRASDLEVEVSVEGEAPGALRPGFLHERADALGGVVKAELLASGSTVVQIRLPLPPA